MRLIYLGSPAFAVPPLEMLVAAGFVPVGVITQPDRPAGRKRVLTPPPVKEAALRLGVPVLQPETLRDPATVGQIAALQPDVGVVVAYGEILRKAVLDIPPLGYLNIHPSLLPRHRGPAPVNGAILAGDTDTGVTIMQLDRGMDSGPILAQAAVPLPHDARAGALTETLIQQGARMLIDMLPRYAAGQVELYAQDHSQATFTGLLKKEDGRIDWSRPASEIERQIRAYDPWPGSFTTWQGHHLKVLEAVPQADTPAQRAPGTIQPAAGELLVATGAGVLQLCTVQPAGKRPMSGSAWLMGQQDAPGQRFGV